MILLSPNALLSDGHLSPHNSGLEALIKTIFFSTKVCDSGLHFVAKSNYFSYTQTSQIRQKIDGVRSSITYSITCCATAVTSRMAKRVLVSAQKDGWSDPRIDLLQETPEL